jgi:hypothetical protein
MRTPGAVPASWSAGTSGAGARVTVAGTELGMLLYGLTSER